MLNQIEWTYSTMVWTYTWKSKIGKKMWEYRRNTRLFSSCLSRLSFLLRRSRNARNFSACTPLNQETSSDVWIGWKFWRNPWRVPSHRMRCKYRPITVQCYIIDSKYRIEEITKCFRLNILEQEASKTLRVEKNVKEN